MLFRHFVIGDGQASVLVGHVGSSWGTCRDSVGYYLSDVRYHVGTGSMDNIEPKTKCCMTGNFDKTCESENMYYLKPDTTRPLML
jgi:hypothetical protein